MGCNGHVAFRGLQERYIKKRWTRLARSGFFRVLAGIPRSISQVESERYITLHALFSAVVRISYREEILCRLLSKHAEMLSSYANKGVEELTTLLQNGFTIQVQMVQFAVNVWSGSAVRQRFKRLCWCAIVSEMWRERCRRTFTGVKLDVEAVCAKALESVVLFAKGHVNERAMLSCMPS
ncbi:hypothetical protein LINPERPRIM_LOCUS35220 [Linum perenne]